MNFIAIALILAFGVLGIRLWELQIVRWSEFRGKSESNRLRIQRLEAPRGTIFGRRADGAEVVLADNAPGLRVVLTLGYLAPAS